MKKIILKILGFKRCEECKKWIWNLKPIKVCEEDGTMISVYICNQCKILTQGE